MAGGAPTAAPGAAPQQFASRLFQSRPMPAQMPQYVAQPSTEGPQPDVTGVNMKVFSGKFGQPIYGPQKEYSPTMAVPAWARAQPTAQPAFTGALFGSQPNPYTAPQSVQQPGSAAPAAKGAK